MDSSAYLLGQGWRGEGYALHPTGRGIKKPLLVSRKNNVLGLGKKKNDVHADQWWARAFDNGLKSLDVSHNGKTSDPISAGTGIDSLNAIRMGCGKWAGLYSGFVKGKGLEGTIRRSSAPIAAEQSEQVHATSESLQKNAGTKPTVHKSIVQDDPSEALPKRVYLPDDREVHDRGLFDTEEFLHSRSKHRTRRTTPTCIPDATRSSRDKRTADKRIERKERKRLRRLAKELG